MSGGFWEVVGGGGEIDGTARVCRLKVDGHKRHKNTKKNWGRRGVNYELLITDCELRITSYELRVTDY